MSGAGVRVLIVEDNDNDAQAMLYALKRRGGFEVRVCASLRVALQSLELFMPDVVVLDLRLPDAKASRTISAIPAFAKAAAVIVYSVLNGRYRKEATDRGATDFIAKGSDSAFKIAAVVRLAAARWMRKTTSRVLQQQLNCARQQTEVALTRLVGDEECQQPNG